MSTTKNQLAVVETDAVVATMNRARTALAEAKTIQQTKRIVDAAAAAEIYARRQKLGEEASDLALSIKVEALRKLGEMLADRPKQAGAILRGSEKVLRGSDAPTLSDLGLTKKESAVAQKLAAMPAEDFEQVRDGHVTVAKAIAAVDAVKATPKRQAEPTVADDAHGDFDPLQALEEAQQEIEKLTAELKAAEADDLKAEALKWRRLYDAATRAQSEAMDRVAGEKKRHDWTHKQLMRCGKVLGITDPDQIAPSVEAFVRQHKKVAA